MKTVLIAAVTAATMLVTAIPAQAAQFAYPAIADIRSSNDAPTKKDVLKNKKEQTESVGSEDSEADY